MAAIVDWNSQPRFGLESLMESIIILESLSKWTDLQPRSAAEECARKNASAWAWAGELQRVLSYEPIGCFEIIGNL